MKNETKKEIKERLSNKTTPKFWKKVRNVSGIIALIGGAILAAPVTLPAVLTTALTITVSVTGAISGTSHLTKK